MRRRNNIFASIDVGAEEVRLLIVEKGLKDVKCLISETFPRDDLSLAYQQIQEYRPKEVILVLPQERVIVRDVTIPPVDKSRIKPMLYFELSGVLPYAMEEVELDYLQLDKARKALNLKVFAIHEHLEREIGFLTEAGIQVNRLVPRGLAVAGYCQACEINKRLVKLAVPGGNLVVYPEYRHYFSKFYHHDEKINEGDLKQDLVAMGVEPERWDLWPLSEPDVDLLGAVYFRLQNPAFNLLKAAPVVESTMPLKVGIAAVILAILLTNAGTFYLDFHMKKAELANYKTRMAQLTPRTDKVKTLKEEFGKVQAEYDSLAKAAEKDTNYLVWLKELHMLLQSDTQVNILVFEDNILRELHGKAPSATRVSERLASSGYFTDIEFTSPITPKVEETGETDEEFSLTAVLVDPLAKEGGGK